MRGDKQLCCEDGRPPPCSVEANNVPTHCCIYLSFLIHPVKRGVALQSHMKFKVNPPTLEDERCMLGCTNPATKCHIPDNLDPQKPHCRNPESRGSLSIRAAAVPEILTKIKYLNESFVMDMHSVDRDMNEIILN